MYFTVLAFLHFGTTIKALLHDLVSRIVFADHVPFTARCIACRPPS